MQMMIIGRTVVVISERPKDSSWARGIAEEMSFLIMLHSAVCCHALLRIM